MILSKKAYDFAQKLLNLNKNKDDFNTVDSNQVKNNNVNMINSDPKRIIGNTDYKKYEDLSKQIENEDTSISNNKNNEALKMGCSNDRRKERQLMDKPSGDKIEAAKIFKNEGDDSLKLKNFQDALNAYEKALLQLFYTFSEDPEEDKKVEIIKASINMNMSMCKINLNKFDDAIGYCLEALRIDKKNLKAIYRIAFSYFKLEKFDDSRKYIQQGLEIQSDMQEFKDLLISINEKEKEIEHASRKLFKKIMK